MKKYLCVQYRYSFCSNEFDPWLTESMNVESLHKDSNETKIAEMNQSFNIYSIVLTNHKVTTQDSLVMHMWCVLR